MGGMGIVREHIAGPDDAVDVIHEAMPRSAPTTRWPEAPDPKNAKSGWSGDEDEPRWE